MRNKEKSLKRKEMVTLNQEQLKKTQVDKIVKKFIKISNITKICKNKKQKGGWLCPAM